MLSIFRTWQWKAGCICLLIAFSSVTLWIYGRNSCAEICFPLLGRQQIVHVVAGHVVWSGGPIEGRREWNLSSRPREELDILLIYTRPAKLSGSVQQLIFPLKWLSILPLIFAFVFFVWARRGQPHLADPN